jgi:hypothetical protein
VLAHSAGKVHTSNQTLKSRIRAQIIELRFDFEHDELAGTFSVGFLQPLEPVPRSSESVKAQDVIAVGESVLTGRVVQRGDSSSIGTELVLTL